MCFLHNFQFGFVPSDGLPKLQRSASFYDGEDIRSRNSDSQADRRERASLGTQSHTQARVGLEC